MSYPKTLKLFPLAVLAASIAACSSSSTPDPQPLASQAVDGYIVGADVECDGETGNVTAAAGRFTCPAGTVLSEISGGSDVGTDPEAVSGGTPFTGVLKAPATSPYVTPLSTLAVGMALAAQASGEPLDLTNFENAQADLAQTLGINPELLNVNPAENTAAAKTNAQVHQVLAAFAPTEDGYEQAVAAFAEVVAESAKTGQTFNLTTDAGTTMQEINNALAAAGSSLEKSQIDLDEITASVAEANNAIENSETPDQVTDVSNKGIVNQAPVTIDRADASVTLTNATSGVATEIGIADFENPQQSGGTYLTTLSPGITNIEYDSSVFQFNQNIKNAKVTVAFSITSVVANDDRSLSFVSDDVMVSAIKGDSDSLMISMLSDKSEFSVIGTDKDGVETSTTVTTNGETLKSSINSFSVNLERINEQLSDLGFEDILKTSGDYKVTLVISGMSINEKTATDVAAVPQITVETADGDVTGAGFAGYVSVIR